MPSYGFRAQVGDGNKFDFSKSAECAGLVRTDSRRTRQKQTSGCEVVEDRWPKSRKRPGPEAGDFVVDGSTGADRQQQQRVLVVGQTHVVNAGVLLVLLLVLLDLFASAICWGGERQKRVNFGTDRQGVGQREGKKEVVSRVVSASRTAGPRCARQPGMTRRGRENRRRAIPGRIEPGRGREGEKRKTSTVIKGGKKLSRREG